MTPSFGSRFGRWLCLALALAGEATATSANEGDEAYSAALCEQAILNGARRGGVPPEVLHAISLTETGRKQNGRIRPYPWAINREGESFWFATREEALAFAKQSLAEGRKSFDVGCVQINYRWHGQAFPSLEAMFDPEYTATYAAQFLRTLYEERGSWSEAAGAYHSLTPELAGIYRKRFDGLLASLDAGALSEAEALVARAEGAPAAGQATARGTRQARREAQRLAAAERIRNAGPPPEPVMGSVAAVAGRTGGGGLLVQGAPMLTQGSPLLSGPAGSLF